MRRVPALLAGVLLAACAENPLVSPPAAVRSSAQASRDVAIAFTGTSTTGFPIAQLPPFVSAYGISPTGDVVGQSATNRGFLWHDGQMTELPLPPLGNAMQARDVNSGGQVVGIVQGLPRGNGAFLYENGVTSLLLGPPGSSDNLTEAYTINERGTVGGRSFVLGRGQIPVLWHDGVATDLGGAGIVYDVNEHDVAVGFSASAPDFRFRATVWRNNQTTILEDLPGATQSAAQGINDDGLISGFSTEASGRLVPVMWGTDGRIVRLPDFGGQFNFAEKVNNAGVIVGRIEVPGQGSRAVVWRDGAVTDLGSVPGGFLGAAGLAINDAGIVAGWGGQGSLVWNLNTAPEVDPTSTTENGPLAVGSHHACATRSNATVVCWGYSPYGQMNVPANEKVTAVAAGFATTCGIRLDKTVGCWGSDGSGQTNVAAGEFTQVSVGQYTVCALRANRTATCWGGGAKGDNELPGTFKEVSAGLVHSCGLRTDATLYCTGPAHFNPPPAPPGKFLRVSAGNGGHGCAIRLDQGITCWGSNSNGQLVGVPTTGKFTQISAGTYNSCALREDGELQCWGYDGPGSFDVTRPPAGPFVFISVGAIHACAQRPNGHIVCWGEPSQGKLDVPAEFRDNEAPVAAAGPDRTVQLSGSRTIGVNLDGSASTDDHPERGLTYTWSEGETALGTGAELSVTLGIGAHTIRLTVSDGELQSTDDVVITVVDPTPPKVVMKVDGELGNNGWYRSDITVRFDVSDLESDITSPPCVDVIIAEDTEATKVGCTARSAGGSSSASQILKRDATIPTIAFVGKLEYTIDEDVSVGRVASDAMSGIATLDCKKIVGPAYTFAASTPLTGRAEDKAGNEVTATATLVVKTTAAGMCALVERWVDQHGVANSLCQKLKNGAMGAFANELAAQSGKAISSENAATLIQLSGRL